MFLNTLYLNFREVQTHRCPGLLRVAIPAKPILLSYLLTSKITEEN